MHGISHEIFSTSLIIMPGLNMRRWNHSEVKHHACDHPAGKESEISSTGHLTSGLIVFTPWVHIDNPPATLYHTPLPPLLAHTK